MKKTFTTMMLASCLLGAYAQEEPGGKYKRCNGKMVPNGYWVHRYSDGSKKAEGNYNNGNKVGKWTAWHEIGNKSFTGTYTNGKPTGQWTYWHTNGFVQSKGKYTRGLKQGLWEAWDDQGTKLETGALVDDKKEGSWTYWHTTTGTKREHGSYANGRKMGAWKVWHENGQLQEIANCTKSYFPDGSRHEILCTVITHYDREGNELVTAGDGEVFYYHDNGLLHIKGTVENGRRHGLWETYYYDGTIADKAKYHSGNLIAGTSYDRHGNPYRYEQQMIKPAPLSGTMRDFYQFVGRELKYPNEAKKEGIEGKVYIEFFVEQDGSLNDVKVINGIGAGCDEEAVRVISKYPEKWTRGVQKGQPVRSKVVIPLTFKLS